MIGLAGRGKGVRGGARQLFPLLLEDFGEQELACHLGAGPQVEEEMLTDVLNLGAPFLR